MIGLLVVLVGIVLVVSVGGFVVGRMVAVRVDRWQARLDHEPAEKERVDDRDSA